MIMGDEALQAPPAEEVHAGLVVDVDERPHRDGPQGDDDDDGEGQIDRGQIVGLQ
jgi:hypothetical protein